MPSYYDQNALTDAQRARYPEAVKAYERVMEQNAELRKASGLPDVYWQIMDVCNGPGPKSALFNRLLEGKEPLPYPPPTAFSYPWYGIVETPGAHRVMLDAGQTLVGEMEAQWSEVEGSIGIIGINQCSWSIMRRNAAAETLAALLSRWKVLPEDQQTTSPLMSEIRRELRDGPEWIVRHSYWPEYRLFYGRAERETYRHYAVKDQLDARLEGLDPVIVRMLRSGCEAREMQARKHAASSTGERNGMEALYQGKDSFLDTLSDEDRDMVRYEAGAWQLEIFAPPGDG